MQSDLQLQKNMSCNLEHLTTTCHARIQHLVIVNIHDNKN